MCISLLLDKHLPMVQWIRPRLPSLSPGFDSWVLRLLQFFNIELKLMTNKKMQDLAQLKMNFSIELGRINEKVVFSGPYRVFLQCAFHALVVGVQTNRGRGYENLRRLFSLSLYLSHFVTHDCIPIMEYCNHYSFHFRTS